MNLWQKTAILGAGAGALVASIAGLSPNLTAGATTSPSLPGVYTQALGDQNIPLQAINGGTNPFTAVTSTPKLPAGSYTYPQVVDIGSVASGSIVLCGTQFTKPTTDDSGDHGVIDNTGGSAAESGQCVMSGAVTVAANTKMSFWAVVYNGPAGAQVNGWSMTVTPVGSITLTS